MGMGWTLAGTKALPEGTKAVRDRGAPDDEGDLGHRERMVQVVALPDEAGRGERVASAEPKGRVVDVSAAPGLLISLGVIALVAVVIAATVLVVTVASVVAILFGRRRV